MASCTEPRGIPILVKDGGNLRPDKEALNAIFMKKKLQGKKISIISIAGAVRKGKSFILNFLLRYLRFRGHTTSNWMGRSTDSLKGFDWSGGMDACTTGLLIWSEVFYVKRDKEEIAVFLMDTQGLFDDSTEANVNALIFSLSTLISSVQIFNLSQQIQENDLTFLQLFTEYAAASGQKKLQDFKDPETDVGPPFQNIIFLIRDWLNPFECEYGFSGGQKYLHRVLDKKCRNPELESVRRHMKSSFESLECCLFPYPGKKVAVVTNEGNKFTGSLSDMDKDFRDNVRKFVEGVLFPDKLVIKTINGQPVTNISLLDYILKCCEYVSSGNLPAVLNLTEPKTLFRPGSVRNKHRDYLKGMIETFQNIRQRNKGTKVKSGKIGVGLVEEYSEAMEMFKQKTSFGPESRSIPILIKEGNKLRPDKEALQQIFGQKKLEGKKIAIISIAGAFREGKSFMLNFFLRYLRVKGYTTKNWISPKKKALSGFDWTGGTNACTSGILVWSEAFFVQAKGEEIAVFLMDTQGLFDSDTCENVNRLIFSLSTLVSSVQIFNLSQRIQEDDLNFLQLFTEYAAASALANKLQESDGSTPKQGPPFQKILFLIRDWPNPDEFEFGIDGGEKYLHKVLGKKCRSPELEKVRSHINSSFEKLSCCLLPYPGECVAVSRRSFKFTGSISDMKGDFRDHLVEFVNGVLHPKELVIKTINGQPVTNISLLNYIVECCEYISSGNLPTVENLTVTLAGATNMEVQRNCWDMYLESMQRKVPKDEYMDEHALMHLHSEQSRKTMNVFREKTAFSPESVREKHRDYLEDMVEKESQNFCQKNEYIKIESEKMVMRLVEEKRRKYIESMKKAIKKEGPTDSLTPDNFKDYHIRCKKEMIASCEKDVQGLHKKFVDDYVEKLSSTIVAEYKRGHRYYLKKRKEDIRKKSTDRKLIAMRFDSEALYRNEMDKLTEGLKVNPRLQEDHWKAKRNAVDDYKRKLYETPELSIQPSRINSEVEALDQNLEEEFAQFEVKNVANKNITKKILEKRRNEIFNQYDEHFRNKLRNGYVKPRQLEEEHLDLQKLIPKSMYDRTEEERTDPLFQEHERIANLELQKKYDEKLAWNKKNRTIFQIIFG